MTDVLNQSTGMSWVSQTHVKKRIISRTFDDPFKLALMLKDINIATELGRTAQLPTPLSALTPAALARRRARQRPGGERQRDGALGRAADRHRHHGAGSRDGGAAAVMRVLVTGAAGFIGTRAGRRTRGAAGTFGASAQNSSFVLTRSVERPSGSPLDARWCSGEIDDPALVDRLFDEPVDVVFHLAGVVSGAAEADYALGKRVNLDATIALLERCRAQAAGGGPVVRFVYASSIAVFGTPLPARIDDATAPEPTLSYGAHKRACELLIDDCTRRGFSTAARCGCRRRRAAAARERRAVGLQQRPDPRAARRTRLRAVRWRPTRRSGSSRSATRSPTCSASRRSTVRHSDRGAR